MLEATQKKLREARFFLSHLEQEQRVPAAHSNPEAAESFFSAFLSAARSVTFAFQKEDKQGYDAWAPTWFQARSTDEKLLLNRFYEERTQVVKRTGSELAGEVVLVPIMRVANTYNPLSVQMLWWGDSVPEVGVRLLRCRFAFDGGETEVVSAAKQYVALLGDLVAGFLEHYRIDGGSLTSA